MLRAAYSYAKADLPEAFIDRAVATPDSDM